MARRVRASTLENRTARLKLEPRKKPYLFTTIAPGLAVGYRRNLGAGKWVLRAANGHGAYWTKAIGVADDFEDSDGKTVLTFYEAQDRAKQLARRQPGDDTGSDSRPASVGEALDAYQRDLEARDRQCVVAGICAQLHAVACADRRQNLLELVLQAAARIQRAVAAIHEVDPLGLPYSFDHCRLRVRSTARQQQHCHAGNSEISAASHLAHCASLGSGPGHWPMQIRFRSSVAGI